MRIKKKAEVTLWNLYCTFDNEPLFKHFKKRLKPLIKSKSKIKGSGEVVFYQFINYEQITIQNELYVKFEFIKKLDINSKTNVNQDGEIYSQNKSLKGVTISSVLIRLTDHKLVFIQRYYRSPNPHDLYKALKKALKSDYIEKKKMLKLKYLERKNLKGLSSKAHRENFNTEVSRKLPNFEINLTPIGDNDKAVNLIDEVARIKSIRVTIPKVNNEDPNLKDGFIKSLFTSRNDFGSQESTKLTAEISDKDGVNKSAVKDVVNDAISTNGIAEFRLTCDRKNNEGEIKIDNNKVEYKDQINNANIISTDELLRQSVIRHLNKIVSDKGMTEAEEDEIIEQYIQDLKRFRDIK